MGWRDHLQKSDDCQVIPWLGGRKLYWKGKAWKVIGPLQREHGWYEWLINGRNALYNDVAERPSEFPPMMIDTGYLVGNRLVYVQKHYTWGDVAQISEKTGSIHLVEPGLDRFSLVSAVEDQEGRLIYKEELFPLGPEDEVRAAYIDRKESVRDIKHVTPALNLAFQFASEQRSLYEERLVEMERRREADILREESDRLREEAERNMGSSAGRRVLAAQDFDAAARSALAVSGAEFLDARQGRQQNEMIVQYLKSGRRLECVVNRRTLQVIDSGVCLTSEYDGEKGDTYFTLESLPSVIQQAIDENVLVIYRHAN